MNSECPHVALKLCLVGESKFYKCLECKRNFTAEPMQIKVTYPANGEPRNSVLEEAAKVADYHHANHCENNDTGYRNCGTAIATGIRDLKAPCAKDERCQP